MATGVLLYPLFSEYELTVALSVLKQGRQPIVTIGISEGPIKGESDLVCLPDRTIDNVDFESLDSILLPGCMDITTLFGRQDLFAFLRKFQDKNIVIASISSSPYLLAEAGLLSGRAYTVGMYPEDRARTGVFDEQLYSNQLVVEDGKLITARGRGYVEFGIRLGHALGLSFDPNWYMAE